MLTTIFTVPAQIFAGLVAAAGGFFLLRRFYRWLKPIRIAPRIRIRFDGEGSDQVLATVTNLSGEDQGDRAVRGAECLSTLKNHP